MKDRLEIKKMIVHWLMKGQSNGNKDYLYDLCADKIAWGLVDLNKRERHAVYMALKAVKR